MATYYIDPVSGDDTKAGTVAVVGGGNAPWKTLAKALGAAGIASGDSVWLKGGATFRETVTVAMVSAVAETKIQGDVDGAAFRAGGDTNPSTGLARWSAYTTNDKTAPAAGTACVTLAGRDFLTFRYIQFCGGAGGNGNCISATTATSQNVTVDKCVFLPGTNTPQIRFACAADTALNFTLTNSIHIGVGGNGVRIDPATSAISDYDMNVQINNCTFIVQGATAIIVGSTGANAFGGGGVDTFNNTYFSGTGVQTTGTTGTAANKQVYVYNSAVVTSGTAFSAAAVNQIVEDWNIYYGVHGANVTTGANTQGGLPYPYALLVDVGQTLLSGKVPRPAFTPQEGSPWLGFGAQAGGPAIDIAGVTRPAGGLSPSFAAGSMERPNTWGKETTTVRTGTTGLSITGPGVQEWELPVDAVSTTVRVWVRRDSTYNGSVSRPQLQIRNGSECGAADQTVTQAGVANAWEQLSVTFTPARAGIVTVRIASFDSNGGGKAFADDLTVTT